LALVAETCGSACRIAILAHHKRGRYAPSWRLGPLKNEEGAKAARLFETVEEPLDAIARWVQHPAEAGLPGHDEECHCSARHERLQSAGSANRHRSLVAEQHNIGCL
jgi:hypothetical protein